MEDTQPLRHPLAVDILRALAQGTDTAPELQTRIHRSKDRRLLAQELIAAAMALARAGHKEAVSWVCDLLVSALQGELGDLGLSEEAKGMLAGAQTRNATQNALQQSVAAPKPVGVGMRRKP